MVKDLNVISGKLKGLRRRARAVLKPAPSGKIENYQSEFVESARVFANYLKQVSLNFPPATGEPIGVIIAPTFGTPAPWFFVMIAIGLRRRGKNVILIHDDIEFEFPTPLNYFLLQNKYITEILDSLVSYFPIQRTSSFAPQALKPDDPEHLDWLVDLNMRWWQRAGPIAENLNATGTRERYCFENHLSRVYTLFDETRFEAVVTVGGVVGASASILRAVRRHKTRFATCDGSFGCLLVCPDGNAAQQADLVRAFGEFWETASPEEIAFAIETGKHEFGLRAHGKDKLQFQAESSKGATMLQADVLMPLNVEWDSSALGRHTIFRDSEEWLRETVPFILKQNKSVIVRQHPSERHNFGRSDFDPRAILGEQVCAHPNFRFVAAADPVNTYDLLENTPLVLTYVSTIGIEAAGMGKQVIGVGSSYYAPLGMVHSPSTRAEYFEMISRGLTNTLPLLPDQIERAWVIYYLAQVCNRVFTDFTPQPPDYWKWVRMSAMTVMNDPVYAMILTALEQNVPISLLIHQARWKRR